MNSGYPRVLNFLDVLKLYASVQANLFIACFVLCIAQDLAYRPSRGENTK